MPALPLSVQLYTIRDAMAEDPGAALERLAGLGFTTVEPFGLVDHVDTYAEFLPRFGLTPSSSHAELIDRDLVPIVQAARRVGVSTLIQPSTPAESWTDSDAVVAIANQLNSVAAILASEGITVGYHNHWWELESSLDGTTALEAFADNLDPAVVLEVDTYWAEVGGVTAAELLTRLGGRVQFIHVKDGDISRDNRRQVGAGSGRMPVLDILAAAPQAVRVVELDDFDGDVFDALADSVAFLTANGERL
jgi:sugar phosphate isomerase/epimerase